MLNILSLVPKSVWFSVATVALIGLTIHQAYNKGYAKADLEWRIKVEEQINTEVKSRLVEIDKQLEKALAFKETKDQIIKTQTDNLDAEVAKTKALQERLNNVLSNKTDACNTLPDDEFRLYQDYLK